MPDSKHLAGKGALGGNGVNFAFLSANDAGIFMRLISCFFFLTSCPVHRSLCSPFVSLSFPLSFLYLSA